MKRVILIVCLLLLASCKSSDSSTPPKSLFSLWTFSNPGCSGLGPLDLSTGSYANNFTAKLYLHPNCECDCNAYFPTSNSANVGLFTFNGCVYVPGGGCVSDPGCSSYSTSTLAGNWSFYNSQLIISDSKDWNTFQNACLWYK